MDRLDRKDLRDAAFGVALRGYDKRQVDERMRFLGAELIAAENALQAATQRIAMLEDELNDARAASASESLGESNFGARVEKILKLAQDEAWEVRSQADATATALLEQAREQAAEQRQQAKQEIAAWRTEVHRQATEQDSALQRRSAELDSAHRELQRARQELQRESEEIRAQAQANADQIRKAVAAEADELFRTATAEADRVNKAARAEAEQLVTQAHAEAQRLVTVASDTAQQRVRSSAHELQQLSKLHNEINTDLYRAKEVLDRLFAATGATPGAILPKRRSDAAQPSHQARTV